MEAVLTFAQSTFRNLPPQAQRAVSDFAPYADVTIWTIVMTLLLGISNPTSKQTSLTIIFLTGFSFIVVAVFLYYFATQMALTQIANQREDLGEAFDPSTFQPGLPLDLTFGYTSDSMIAFLDALGHQGRKAFATYLQIDFIAILIYTYLHRSILSNLYPEDDSLAFITSKLPLVLGAFDLYENIGLLVFLATSNNPAKFGRMSEEYLGRVFTANMTKFALFWGILGLEAAGIFKMFVGDGKKSEEKIASIEGSVEQKKANERRNKRLEKKKKAA